MPNSARCARSALASYGWGGVWGWHDWVGPGAGWWPWGYGHGYHDWRGGYYGHHGYYGGHHGYHGHH